MDVLFVCTANINRSPMAQGLFATRLASLGVRASVSSAGLLPGGQPASSHAVSVLAARGVDISAHRSRQLDGGIVAGADLILTMERQHLRAAAVTAPGAFLRTFTLKELLRRALRVGARPPAMTLSAWLAQVNDERDPASLLHDDVDDEVADPVGGTRIDFERTAEELELLVRGLSWCLFEGGG